MKNKLLICLLFAVNTLCSNIHAQSETHDFITYDTTVSLEGNFRWNLRITRPRNMFTANHPDTASRPGIVFMTGMGEANGNFGVLAMYGPHYWLGGGWSGGIQLGNGMHYPIIISVQSYTTNITTRAAGNLLIHIMNTYHIKRNSLHCTGLSQGALTWQRLLNAQRTYGDRTYMKMIKSVSALSGQGNPYGDSLSGSGWVLGGDVTVAPDWQACAIWVNEYGGKYFALEGISDNVQAYLWMGTQAMNNARPGSAYFSYYPSGHCCWNTMYDPGMTNWNCVAPLGPFITTGYAPNTMGTYKNGDNLFRWMLRQGDTTLVGSSSQPPPPAANQAPVANAGTAQTITLPTSTVTLSGSGTDPDGTINAYAWTQISGTAATIASPATASTNITGLTTAGTRVFRLTVTDNQGASGSSDVTIIVNPAPAQTGSLPYINTNNPQTISGTTASLASTAAGNGGIASLKWTKFSVPNQTAKKLGVMGSSTAAANGVTSFDSAFTTRLKAYYQSQGLLSDMVNIAQAGTSPFDINITQQLNALNGANILLISYPSNGYTAATNNSVLARLQEIYDSASNRGMIVYVSGTQPRDDFNDADRANLITLNGLLANKFGNRFMDFLTPLLKTSNNKIKDEYYADGIHPNNAGHRIIFNKVVAANIFENFAVSASAITNSSSANTNITGLTAGTHQFQVSVIDNAGYAASAVAKITVTSSGNQSPNANAGADQTITLPGSSLTLSGSGTDPDGTISSYAWTQVSGTVGTIASPSTSSTNITGLTTAGVRVFRLTVTDNSGAAGTDDVTITVNAAIAPPPPSPSNQLPTANAGADQTINYPISAVTLSGGGTDPDGTIVSYAWSQVSGTAATINSPSTNSTNITGLGTTGVRVFRLTVTDNKGATATDDITITVNGAAPPPAVNQSPVANAGQDQTITLPVNSVTVYGNGSSDPDGTITGYTWSKIAGPSQFTITSPSLIQTTITNLVQGVYQFELKVTDNQGATATDVVIITVNAAVPPPVSNQLPTANAGADQTIIYPLSSVTLTGSGTDPDGTIVSYAWSQISGTAATINSPSTYSTNITGLTAAGVRVFRLTVTDNNGATATDDITITVNAAVPPPPSNQLPTANAGADQTITYPLSSVTLTGSGTDPDGTIVSYAWSQVSGTAATINSPSTYSTNITGLTTAGVRVFRLTVTDNNGATATDDVTITVNAAPPPPVNQAPVANAGQDQTITLPVNSVTVYGNGSSDPDGTIVSYTWSKIAGPSQFTIISPSLIQTTITDVVQGVYQFELKVTDNQGATATDVVIITVNAAVPSPVNQAPVANAGADQTITLPVNNVTVYGNGSSDPDGTIVSYAWSKIAGPSQFTITSPSLIQTTITNLVQGVYQFELKVTDNQGATATDIVIITVNAAVPPPAVNQPPVANAGVDQTITLPVNNVTVNGNGSSDPDGTIASYQWSKIAGPSQFTITAPSQIQTTITNLVQGVYQFELKVTDNQGATATDIVVITVNAAILPPVVNQAPVAKSGVNQSITLPLNTVTVNGSGSTDADGTIVSYQWSKIAGPSQYTIETPTQVQTVINSLVKGVYQFELKVTDNQGAIDKDTVSIFVNEAGHQSTSVPVYPNPATTYINVTIDAPLQATG
ncbi:MAG: PKD domain-containing protein [Chitinophagaceae bacterium]